MARQFWRARGVDDAVLRRKDANGNGVYDEAGDSGYYQLTDSSFSVICHVDSTSGAVRQWMSYDGYGNVKVLRPGDFDGDGTVTTQDQTQFNAAYNAVPPLPSADFNGDGTVDSTDADGFNAAYSAASTPADEVRIGYAGYVRDPLTEFLLARNRWYEPGAGRWVTRDPAGYVDGLSLYLYAKGNPLSLVDPTGLLGQPPGLLQRIANFFSLSGGQSPSPSDDSTPAAVESVQQAGKVLDAADSVAAPLAEAAAAARPYAEAAGSMVPGVGEMQDIWTVASPESSFFDRAAAVTSLGVNALTAGFAPNYSGVKGVGKIVGPHVAEGLAKAAEDAERVLGKLGKQADELVEAAGNAGKKLPGKVHGNTAGDQAATLYELYDKDGNFLKHGVSQDPNRRYTQKQLNGGDTKPIETGPRREMLNKERERVETDPGPLNKETWAGKRRKP